RPYEGIRQVIRVVLEKYRSLNGKRKMKCGVRKILTRDNKAYGLELESGETITADKIISSIGLVETTLLYAGDSKTDVYASQSKSSARRTSGEAEEHIAICDEGRIPKCNNAETWTATRIGTISFFESIAILNEQPKNLGWKDTIVFFNDSEH